VTLSARDGGGRCGPRGDLVVRDAGGAGYSEPAADVYRHTAAVRADSRVAPSMRAKASSVLAS
jgi:hypothetical protein